VFGVHDLWLFVLSGLLLNITPGPDTLYIVGRSSVQGLRAGAVAALGIGAGALVHVCAASLGLSAILAASATAFTAVKITGAAYLVYVGVSLIGSKSSIQSPPVASGSRQRHDMEFARRLVDGAHQRPARGRQHLQSMVQSLRRDCLRICGHPTGAGSRSLGKDDGEHRCKQKELPP
jgi:LysE type translocator